MGSRSGTVADHYRDYTGRPLAFRWVADEDSQTINIHLAKEPAPEAHQALSRAVAAWYQAGWEGDFPPSDELTQLLASFPGGDASGQREGGFHQIYGPTWDGHTARWVVDIGQADGRQAFAELARRLAGWAVRWNCPIERLYLGVEEI